MPPIELTHSAFFLTEKLKLKCKGRIVQETGAATHPFLPHTIGPSHWNPCWACFSGFLELFPPPPRLHQLSPGQREWQAREKWVWERSRCLRHLAGTQWTSQVAQNAAGRCSHCLRDFHTGMKFLLHTHNPAYAERHVGLLIFSVCLVFSRKWNVTIIR